MSPVRGIRREAAVMRIRNGGQNQVRAEVAA